MDISSVITGDIVGSSKLTLNERDNMLDVLYSIPSILSPVVKIDMEVFRGDSFQIGIKESVDAIRVGLVIRAYLRSHKMETTGMLLDARLAIGIGKVEYETCSLATSDGEAFRKSGRLLDKMDKRRLEICTPWREVNEELNLSTAFVDDIVSSWTQTQSRIECAGLLSHKSHTEIAKELGISRQMVDKSMLASKERLIRAYIERFEKLIMIKQSER